MLQTLRVGSHKLCMLPYLLPLGLAQARMDVRALSCDTRPALATDTVCCSITCSIVSHNTPEVVLVINALLVLLAGNTNPSIAAAATNIVKTEAQQVSSSSSPAAPHAA
jgi:hypothetical protein